MIRFFGRFRKQIFVSMAFVLLLGSVVGLGSYLFVEKDTTASVAVVGGEKIPYTRFTMQVNRVLDRMRESGGEVSDDMRLRVEQEIFQEMVVEELLYQQAEKLGLRVTDLELATEIHHTPAFQRSGAFDQRLYHDSVRYLFGMSPAQYEEWRRRSLTALKYRQFVFMAAKPSPAEVEAEYKARNPKSKDFAKEKDQFASSVQQERMISLLNFLLRQLAAQVEIRSFLDERRQGR